MHSPHPLPRSPRCRALVESFRRADIKAQASFTNHELDDDTQANLFSGVYDRLKTGTLKIHTRVADGADQVGSCFKCVRPSRVQQQQQQQRGGHTGRAASFRRK